jgi:hypothetical protein
VPGRARRNRRNRRRFRKCRAAGTVDLPNRRAALPEVPDRRRRKCRTALVKVPVPDCTGEGGTSAPSGRRLGLPVGEMPRPGLRGWLAAHPNDSAM